LPAGCGPLDQALSALRKATAVCEDVFAGEDCMLVHLSTHAPASRLDELAADRSNPGTSATRNRTCDTNWLEIMVGSVGVGCGICG